jgi:hypothetical protein
MVVKACDLALSFANTEALLFFSLLGILTAINGGENMQPGSFICKHQKLHLSFSFQCFC